MNENKNRKKKKYQTPSIYCFFDCPVLPVMIIAQYNCRKLTHYRLILTNSENNILFFDNLKAFQHFS